MKSFVSLVREFRGYILAEWLEPINYEVSCVIGKRIPRIYTKDGKAVKVLNYLM